MTSEASKKAWETRRAGGAAKSDSGKDKMKYGPGVKVAVTHDEKHPPPPPPRADAKWDEGIKSFTYGHAVKGRKG